MPHRIQRQQIYLSNSRPIWRCQRDRPTTQLSQCGRDLSQAWQAEMLLLSIDWSVIVRTKMKEETKMFAINYDYYFVLMQKIIVPASCSAGGSESARDVKKVSTQSEDSSVLLLFVLGCLFMQLARVYSQAYARQTKEFIRPLLSMRRTPSVSTKSEKKEFVSCLWLRNLVIWLAACVIIRIFKHQIARKWYLCVVGSSSIPFIERKLPNHLVWSTSTSRRCRTAQTVRRHRQLRWAFCCCGCGLSLFKINTLILRTQKWASTLTLNDRSIKWSGVSSNARPDTTPALFINKVICEMTRKEKKNNHLKCEQFTKIIFVLIWKFEVWTDKHLKLY